MDEISDGDLRTTQLCPGWCDGNDHLLPAAEFGNEPTHYANVGESRMWEVWAEQPTRFGGGWSVVCVSGLDEAKTDVNFQISTSTARSLAALLTAAADRVELERPR